MADQSLTQLGVTKDLQRRPQALHCSDALGQRGGDTVPCASQHTAIVGKNVQDGMEVKV